MYKCKIGVLFFIYLQILPWNKVALCPPSPPKERNPQILHFWYWPGDKPPAILLPPIHSHLRLYFTFKLGWNCLQQRYVWEFSSSLISMEIRCRAALHPKAAVSFYLYKSVSFLYLHFLVLLNLKSLIVFARLSNIWHLTLWLHFGACSTTSFWDQTTQLSRGEKTPNHQSFC